MVLYHKPWKVSLGALSYKLRSFVFHRRPVTSICPTFPNRTSRRQDTRLTRLKLTVFKTRVTFFFFFLLNLRPRWSDDAHATVSPARVESGHGTRRHGYGNNVQHWSPAVSGTTLCWHVRKIKKNPSSLSKSCGRHVGGTRCSEFPVRVRRQWLVLANEIVRPGEHRRR